MTPMPVRAGCPDRVVADVGVDLDGVDARDDLATIDDAGPE